MAKEKSEKKRVFPDLRERLKKVRLFSGKPQKEFAESLGVSFRGWQQYEAGENFPGGQVFEALSKMGFNANWLLTGDGPMRKEVVAQDPKSEALRQLGISPSTPLHGSHVEEFLAKEIGKRIAEVRGEISPEAFAKVLGCPAETLGYYEDGKRFPPPPVLNRICTVYSVKHRWLTEGVGPMQDSGPVRPDRGEEAEVKPTPISQEPAFDADVFKQVFILIEDYFNDHDLDMPSDKKADLIMACYEFWIQEDEEKRDKYRLFRLIKIATA